MAETDTNKLREGMGLDKKSDTSSAEAEGRIEQATGEAKEEIGRATGNRELETDGAVEKAGGVLKENLAETEQEVARAIDDVGDTARRD